MRKEKTSLLDKLDIRIISQRFLDMQEYHQNRLYQTDENGTITNDAVGRLIGAGYLEIVEGCRAVTMNGKGPQRTYWFRPTAAGKAIEMIAPNFFKDKYWYLKRKNDFIEEESILEERGRQQPFWA